MKTIYNTYVVMESQEQCDRMKQLCIDNKLFYWQYSFEFKENEVNIFSCPRGIGDFYICPFKNNKTQVTETEFIKLLKMEKLGFQCCGIFPTNDCENCSYYQSELKKDNNQYLEKVKEEIKERFTNTISIPNEVLDKGFEKTKATINQFLGICKEKNCEEKATKDYNGHEHFVCNFHYDKLNKEFDEDYR